jgi:ATP-dependent Clp protease ATP-binding subunit ClpB
VDYLVKKSFSQNYGARNLRRTIQQELEDPIAEKIIESFETPITGVRLEADGDSVTVISES